MQRGRTEGGEVRGAEREAGDERDGREMEEKVIFLNILLFIYLF